MAINPLRGGCFTRSIRLSSKKKIPESMEATEIAFIAGSYYLLVGGIRNWKRRDMIPVIFMANSWAYANSISQIRGVKFLSMILYILESLTTVRIVGIQMGNGAPVSWSSLLKTG